MMKNSTADQAKQDDYLKSNISNMISFARNRNSPKFSTFLDERQRQIAQEILNSSRFDHYRFFGGIDNCERVILGVFPEGADALAQSFPIVPLTLAYSQKNKVSHRDCLGSLMGLQIKREAVGDIVVEDSFAIVFVDEDIAEFILQNLSKAGNATVSVSVSQSVEVEKKQEVQVLTDTVSSLRLDCVVAFLLSKSRTIAAQTIGANLVKVNHQETQNVSKQIGEGDVITIRGKGKFILQSPIKITKKDRCFITVNKLL